MNHTQAEENQLIIAHIFKELRKISDRLMDSVRVIEGDEEDLDTRAKELYEITEDISIQSLFWKGIEFFTSNSKDVTIDKMIEVLESTRTQVGKCDGVSQIIYILQFYKNTKKLISAK